MKFGLGQSVPRLEDPRLLSGAGRYTDDISLQGQVYAAFVRSPHAHARFTVGDLAPVHARHPGLARILGAGDVPGVNGFGIYPTVKDQPVLAPGVTRYRGEAVLALVGDKDPVLPARLHLDRLRELLADHPDFTGEELAGLNHLFQTAVTGSPLEYATLDAAFSPAAARRVRRALPRSRLRV